MANIKSAIKRIRQNVKRRERNRIIRSRTRTFVRSANDSLSEGDKEQAAEVVLSAVSALDRAAQKGIIHHNSAARRKSRLMKRLNGLQSS